MTADEYQETAGALARETKMSSAAAGRIEKELMRAMTSTCAETAWPARGPLARPWRSWAAVAASIAVIVGAALIWRTMSFSGRDTAVPPPPPAVQTMAAIGSALPPPAIEVSASNAGRRAAQRPSRGEKVVRLAGFVALPWAAGLPVFESGEIVRMEVPVASLPVYGIDISSGAARPVQADILIGQDGLARAIRLVTNTARSTQ